MSRLPIWMRSSAPAATGRPAEWSRTQITEAALAVADADGLAAVTMRRVAARLGTGAASLYRHVATRDDLLDLMIDAALSDFRPPPVTGEPRADVVTDLMARLRFVRDRPWLVDALDARPTIGPQGARLTELTLQRLAGVPAGGEAKLEAVGVLAGLVQAQARHERQGDALDPETAAAQIAFLRRTAADGAHPHLAAALAEASPNPEEPDVRFARLLGRVLDGLLPASPDERS